MVINKANYCFQKNGIWYFRKKIPLNLNKKQPLFRVSLIALLGKKNYYNLLLNSSLFNVILNPLYSGGLWEPVIIIEPSHLYPSISLKLAK